MHGNRICKWLASIKVTTCSSFGICISGIMIVGRGPCFQVVRIIGDIILFEVTGQLNYSIGEEDESVQFQFNSCPNQHSWGRSQDHLLLTPAAVQKVFI